MEEKMKKIRLFTLLILTLALAALLLSGCKKQDKVSAIALKDHTSEDVIEMKLGNFDFGAYSLTVSYESGSTEEIALAEEMINSSDAVKFYQEGEHEITVSYGGAACTFKISVKRASFDYLRFPENNVFTYDGTTHTVEVVGNIPANATVIYPAGNTFVNAGTYNVTAVVTCDGFVTERLSTTVTVKCAKHDMSDVRFEEREFVYDGKAHTAQITGTLPKGVSAPTYSINGTVNGTAIDVGMYVVVATFSNPDPNYEPIPPMQTLLKITPADYDLPELDIVFHNETGEMLSTSSKVYDGKKVVFSINEPSIIGKDISVSYTVTDENGKPIVDHNGNGVMAFENAGVYTVQADIFILDEKNYNKIAPIVRTFKINKAKYDLSVFDFDSKLVIYDGNAHNIIVKIPEGHDVQPEDITYEYRLNGEMYVSGNNVGISEAGEYTVTAMIAVKNPNYEQIKLDDMPTAALKIEKKTIDTSAVGFEGISHREYDGTVYTPSFNVLYDGEGVESDLILYADREYFKRNESGVFEKVDVNETKNVGFYKCTLAVSVKDKNNYTLEGDASEMIFSFEFEVYQKDIDIPEISFENVEEFVYNGTAQVPDAVYDSSDFWTVKISYAKVIGMGMSNNFEMLPEGEVPVDAGAYVIIATVSVNDPVNYIFSSGSSSAEFTCEFAIDKIKIDASKLFEDNVAYTYCNTDLRLRSFELLDPEIKQYLSCMVIYVTWNQGDDNWTSPEGDVAVYVGKYRVTYEIRIKDPQNVAFTDGKSVASVNHNFRIE